MHSALEDATGIEKDLADGALAHLRWVLDHVRSALDMDVAFISRFIGDQRKIDHVSVAPHAFDLDIDTDRFVSKDDTGCWKVASGLFPSVMQDACKTLTHEQFPMAHVVPVGGHISVPIIVDGAVIGMLCCFSRDAKPGLNQDHEAFLSHFAALAAIDLRILDETREVYQAQSNALRTIIQQARFSSVFQPIFDLSNASIHYLEGLTRIDPALNVTVVDVLAQAREFGMGCDMELAFAERLMQVATSQTQSPQIGVNLSEKSLISDEFLRFLARHDHRGTVIELTEHEPVHNEARLLDRIAQARRHGAKLALDDTGGGYSSLHNILALRPDILKIDKSITDDIETDKTVGLLVSHLNGYCADAGADLVVEGVETPGQLATLHRMGVRYAQGYLLGRPTPHLDRQVSEVTGAAALKKAVS